ncbi:MAG TPA: hypothetical protein VM123_01815 [archaeon]|nr:hypothetical protein [archaeon]
MYTRSKLGFPLVITVFLILFFITGTAIINAGSTKGFVKKIQPVSSQLAEQGKEDRWKEAEENFKKMCEFLELDKKQTEEASKLFNDRCKEMEKFFSSIRSGELSRIEARDKMVESFKKYREKFEQLLNEEQKAKLGLWEEAGPPRSRRG